MMHDMLMLAFLLPLGACLPPLIKADTHPASVEVLAKGQTWLDLAQFNWDDYVLSGVSLDCNRETSDTDYQCQYKFHWDDPNYNESMDCCSDFNWDGLTLEQGPNNNFSTGYVVCETHQWWQFRFEQVRSLWDFNMTLSKDHKDPQKFGEYTAQFFAFPNITMEKMGESDFRSLVYSTTGPVRAKIQGLVM